VLQFATPSAKSDMEIIWPVWAIGLLVAVTGKNETTLILSGLPWWHRVLGTVAAVAFYGAHLWPLIGGCHQ